MPPNAARIHARKVSGAVLAVGHLVLFVLAVTGHLTPTVPSEFRLLSAATTLPLWPALHATAAVAICGAMIRGRGQESALYLSTGALGPWGLVTLMAALTATSRVSLAGPVLALILACLAYSVAMSWAVAPGHEPGHEPPGHPA